MVMRKWKWDHKHKTCTTTQTYLFSYSGKDNQEGHEEGGEGDVDDDIANIFDRRRSIHRGVQNGAAIVAEGVEPACWGRLLVELSLQSVQRTCRHFVLRGGRQWYRWWWCRGPGRLNLRQSSVVVVDTDDQLAQVLAGRRSIVWGEKYQKTIRLDW